VIRYDSLVRKTVDEKERVAKEVFSKLEDCIALKNHVETSLNDFQTWITQQESESGGPLISAQPFINANKDLTY
jgi:hypothetical protein